MPSENVNFPAQQHFRRIFDRRTPAELRTLAHIKRFMERLAVDKSFAAALAANPENPGSVAAGYGIDIDPLQGLPLWRDTHFKYFNSADSAPWPLARAWYEYRSEMESHVDMMREEGDMSSSCPRFHAWRRRQIRRCDSELGIVASRISHPIIAFELSDGCTVGCWFCGVAADRFKGHYDYSPEHAELWRGVLGVVKELFGRASRTGFCYWATDPCDNPDYDCFLLDFYRATGALPQTTTAAPLKNLALTRRVLALFDKYRTVANRFSVLTPRQLDQIHATFSAEEMMGVELVMQTKGTPKANAGRARERQDTLRAVGTDDLITMPEVESTTIACVSGFLVNMIRGRIQLVTPVPGSKRWPLGYRVVAEHCFETADEFRAALERIIDEHMQSTLPVDRPVRFRADLTYEADADHFRLKGRRMEHRVPSVCPSLGCLINRGTFTPPDLITQVMDDGGDLLAVAGLLERLYEAGLIEEDFDDHFASQRNSGLQISAGATP